MPLKPIVMKPAYRSGSSTPWGGSRLKSLFNRDIPDEKTGESLEISAIDGLNSRDLEGNSLLELIEKYGDRLCGAGFSKPFPLLLKIISADDKLSVQVHPNDEYSKKHENKLGKTEAWIILDAEEGAELIFGIEENTSKEDLKMASLEGKAVEKLLKRIKVKKGDAFFIPAGTVHAIGQGIVLYEIQQSSDVTYRFYDWDRKDKNGNKRELHLEKALDVTNIDAPSNKAVPKPLKIKGKGEKFEVFSCEFFETLLYKNVEQAEISAYKKHFALLTSVEEGKIEFEGETLNLNKAQSVFLPADGYDIKITGKEFYLSYPK